MLVGAERCTRTLLFEVSDPPDAFPNYSVEIKKKTEKTKSLLAASAVHFRPVNGRLLATEDELLGFVEAVRAARGETVAIFDITALPKRYFCFLIKRMMRDPKLQGLIACYTQPGKSGYTSDHLAQDPMTCDHLPGFGGPLLRSGDHLAVSLGFETLGLRSLIGTYHYSSARMRVIVPMPMDVTAIARQWRTLKELGDDTRRRFERNKLEIVPTWDSEQVYNTLQRWSGGTNELSLAPYGPKPHTLAMALFALKHGSGMYYSQPKSYNPDYSRGVGLSWGYVLKWDGIACYDRVPALA
jgi:hypothetical protein